MSQLIETYFPELDDTQRAQFAALGSLYAEWNEKVNVISRKDIDNLYERHILHSLGIAKFISWQPGAKVLDVGTGGGFPGIPLAILFPEVEFRLVDSVGKKIKVVRAVTDALHLTNAIPQQQRGEKIKAKFDFVVARAVARMRPFYQLIKKKIRQDFQAADLPNGILYLKGGDLSEELEALPADYEVFELREVFDAPFFETKKVVFVPA